MARLGAQCKTWTILVFSTLILLASIGCTAVTGQRADDSGRVSAFPDPLPYEADPSDYLLIRSGFTINAYLDEEDLVAHSDLIVSGAVVGASDSYMVKPAEGSETGAEFYTDYYLEVNDVLFDSQGASPLAETSTVALRVDGGVGTQVLAVSDDDPHLAPGATYLLFLCRDDPSSPWRTDDDYYRIVGAKDGVWVEGPDGVYASQTHDFTVTAEELRALAVELGGTEVNAGLEAHQEFLEEIKARVQSGELPADAYDRYVEEERRMEEKPGVKLEGDEMLRAEEEIVAKKTARESSGHSVAGLA